MGVTRRSCLEAQTANRRELAVERAAKKDAVESLNGLFKTTSVAVVAHYSGLTVAQMQKLRMQMKQAGASVKVSKNRLAKIALEGTDVVAIGSLLKGPTVIATSNDPVAAPKVAIEFAKANEQFVILGGSMGKTVLDVNGVKALASLPSLDELRARSSASWWRRRPRSLSSRLRPRPSSRASSRPMPQRAKRPDALRKLKPGSNQYA
jgi:large subunit ribosomal protein L10